MHIVMKVFGCRCFIWFQQQKEASLCRMTCFVSAMVNLKTFDSSFTLPVAYVFVVFFSDLLKKKLWFTTVLYCSFRDNITKRLIFKCFILSTPLIIDLNSYSKRFFIASPSLILSLGFLLFFTTLESSHKRYLGQGLHANPTLNLLKRNLKIVVNMH